MIPAAAAPTDGLGALAASARCARAAASTLRWLAACAVAFAALLALAVVLATVDRSGPPESAQTSASAYLDFDLAVLRALADRSFASGDSDGALHALWARRPAWELPEAAAASGQLVPLRDAWAASVAGRSRFRAAARGVLDAHGLLLTGLSLALAAAATAGAFAERVRAHPLAKVALGIAALLLVALPVWPLLDPALFYDRTRSLGTGLPAALFVAAFGGAMSGAAARALFAPAPQPPFLGALRGRPAILSSAQLSAVEATRWLVPLVPALAAAAVFACAKADQDPSAAGPSSGLGSLIRAAMREAGAADRLSSAALAGGAMVVLWYLGHRFVAEVRASLSASESGR